jgi:aspartyl-tRNA(Asn)/glutamyl-tRNA(Gln) amidotransferase subunit B
VRLGLNFEIARQGVLLDTGKEVIQETRLWNENRDQTEPMRTKENAQDYRYFPEPDIPVFSPDPAFLARVEAALVELPQARIKRVEAEYGLSPEHADLICDEKACADYFEEAVREAEKLGLEKTDAACRINNWILSGVKHILNREGIGISAIGALKLTPRRLASLAALGASGRLSGKNAKQTLEAVITEDKDPEAIIKERGWERLADPDQIAKAVNTVHEAEGPVFEEARSADNPKRRRTLAAYLVGKVLEQTGGRADPRIAGEQIEALISG